MTGPELADPEAQSEAEAPESLETGAPPAVLAVVVTRNPGPWLEETLASLSAQDYPRLTVLVVDVGSTEDPSARVDEAMPRAFVRRVAEGTGFAAAANQALAALEHVPFLLVCHDDVVLDPPAVRLLLEEAYRSNAGIVGPKLVDVDDPQVLLEVGRAIDRYGASHTGIEPGELDQEQHDGVRDVFYVSSATMLVRSDLFRELGGFDPATFPGAEDLDLCWRARLAGARVMVAPDARVRHREAAEARTKADRPDAKAVARSRVRTLLTSYSFWSLIWVVPVGLVLAVGEAIVALLTRRRGGARAALGGWWWNLRHLGEVRAARRACPEAAPHPRPRPARAPGPGKHAGALLPVAPAPHRGTAPIDHRRRSERGRRCRDGVRQPVAVACLIALVLFVIGSRDLVLGRIPAVGTFAHWVGFFDLLETYSSGWRFTGMGSPAPAPAAFAFMAALGAPLLGAMGMAQTLVIVGAIPIGAIGAYRVARPWVGSVGPAVVTGLAYGVSAVPRNAIAAGRLGPLVLYALGPYVVAAGLRVASGTARSWVANGPRDGHRDRDRDRVLPSGAPVAPGRGRRAAGGLGAGQWQRARPADARGDRDRDRRRARAPDAVAARVPRGRRGRARVRVPAVVVDRRGVAAGERPQRCGHRRLRAAGGGHAPAGDRHRCSVGVGGAGVGARTGRSGDRVGAGPVRPRHLRPGPRGRARAGRPRALVRRRPRCGRARRRRAPAVPLRMAPAGGRPRRGRARARAWWGTPPTPSTDAGTHPSRDWQQTLSFLEAEQVDGRFRVLWVGDPSVLPFDPAVAENGVGYVLTRDGPGDGRSCTARPSARATVWSAIPSISLPTTAPTGSGICSRRWVCVSSRSPNAPGPTPRSPRRCPPVWPARWRRRPIWSGSAPSPGSPSTRTRRGFRLVLWSPRTPRAMSRWTPRTRSELRCAPSSTMSRRSRVTSAIWPRRDRAPCCSARRTTATGRGAPTGESLDHVEPFGFTNGYVVPDALGVHQVRRSVPAVPGAGVPVRGVGDPGAGVDAHASPRARPA